MDDELLNVFSGSGPPMEDIIPGLQYVWETKKMAKLKGFMKIVKDIFGQKYQEHLERFNKGMMILRCKYTTFREHQRRGWAWWMSFYRMISILANKLYTTQ